MSDGRLGRRVSSIWGEVKPRGYYLCLIFNLISYICFLGDENLDEMIDEELILSGVNRKNEKAWASLYDHYYAALCAYVNRILKGSESTEDLVQEVLKDDTAGEEFTHHPEVIDRKSTRLNSSHRN